MAVVSDSLAAVVVVASVVVSVGAAVLVEVVVDVAEVVAAVVSAVVVVAICFLQAVMENRVRMMQTQMATEKILRFILLSPIIMAADGMLII